MAVVRDTAFPLNNYPSGTFQIPSMNIQNGATRVTFEIARCTSADPTIWPNANTKLKLDLEFSPDNGQTWIYAGGITAVGGIHVDRFGNEATRTRYTFQAPDGNRRRLRGTVVIENGPLRTQGTLEVE